MFEIQHFVNILKTMCFWQYLYISITKGIPQAYIACKVWVVYRRPKIVKFAHLLGDSYHISMRIHVYIYVYTYIYIYI